MDLSILSFSKCPVGRTGVRDGDIVAPRPLWGADHIDFPARLFIILLVALGDCVLGRVAPVVVGECRRSAT